MNCGGSFHGLIFCFFIAIPSFQHEWYTMMQLQNVKNENITKGRIAQSKKQKSKVLQNVKKRNVAQGKRSQIGLSQNVF
jgi:hypothetical protein